VTDVLFTGACVSVCMCFFTGIYFNCLIHCIFNQDKHYTLDIFLFITNSSVLRNGITA